MRILFTLKSVNVKTGPIPVSTSSSETCPDACPLRDAGCYAQQGRLGMIWRSLSRSSGATIPNGPSETPVRSWNEFLAMVASLVPGTLWRHNQAGDLPGNGDAIDAGMLEQLVEANQGKRGFTYTHKPLSPGNAAAIKAANDRGFTVNLSADTASEADELVDAAIGPVVAVLPEYMSGHTAWMTPKGRRVVVCPATYRDDVTCQSCGLCAVRDRKVIVGFPAHGSAKRQASKIAAS